MNLTKKNLLMYGVVFFVLPLIIILLMELGLAALYYVSGSKVFEDRLETLHRAGLDVRKEFKSGSKAIGGAKTVKVAVFGGSSAAGYASPTSFAELLGNSDFTGKNFEVHNYARSGEPFAGFQSELLMAVMPDYDVLVVYAGHNEVWQQIYSRARKSPTQIVLPNGYRIPFGSAPYADLERRLKRIRNSQSGISRGEIVSDVANWIADRSRFFWFSNRLIFKTLALIPAFNPDRLQSYTPKFFYTSEFITHSERQLLVKEFEEAIHNISGRLRPDQTLVISPEIVNDLFPPLAEAITDKNTAEVERYESTAKKSYEKLAAGEYQALQPVIQELPPGAHRIYLESMLCLSKAGFRSASSQECLKTAEEARRLDKLPYRVVPEIQAFIRKFKSKNVVVVDPTKVHSESPANWSEYHEYFVDFQHPSPKGHLVIADAIMTGLYPDYRSQGASAVDQCGNITLASGDRQGQVIKTKPVVQAQQFDTNLVWLDNFIAAQPSPYPYAYFKQRAQAAKAVCSQKADARR